MQEYDLTHGTEMLGHGGTKTVVEYESKAIALPNAVDGESLRDQWPRIINDEMCMSSYLTTVGIPTLSFHRCKVHTADYDLETIFTDPFHKLASEGTYVVDRKNTSSTMWSQKIPDISLFREGVNKYDPAIWIPLIKPLVEDIKTICSRKIRLGGDAMNLAFVKHGSKHHSGSNLPFEIRIFCFDLSSKHHPLEIHSTYEPSFESILYGLIEYSVWEELCPNRYVLSKEASQLLGELYKSEISVK